MGARKRLLSEGHRPRTLKPVAFGADADILRRMLRSFVLILFLFCCVVLSHAAEWQVVKVGGRDYLTLDNLAQFYGFGSVQRAGKTFLLHSPGRSLRGESGSVEFLINGL